LLRVAPQFSAEWQLLTARCIADAARKGAIFNLNMVTGIVITKSV